MKLISLISLGIFLFLIFFQPFTPEMIDPDERLVFAFGLAAIAFVVLLLFRVVLPVSITKRIRVETIKISNEVGLVLTIWLLISTANFFYIHYFGRIGLSLYIILKIILFSAFPSVILKLADVNMALRVQLRHYVRRNLKLEKDLSERPDHLNAPVTIRSESQNETIQLMTADIILLKAADNYVEIIYREDDEPRKKVVRNTLKNIAKQLNEFPDFLRCHRSCIVNRNYIIHLTNSYKGHRMSVIDIEDDIPVSRQYLNTVREALNDER
jgi:hypothetical protein